MLFYSALHITEKFWSNFSVILLSSFCPFLEIVFPVLPVGSLEECAQQSDVLCYEFWFNLLFIINKPILLMSQDDLHADHAVPSCTQSAAPGYVSGIVHAQKNTVNGFLFFTILLKQISQISTFRYVQISCQLKITNM